MWAVGHLCNSSGVYLLHVIDWQAVDMDAVIYCDACLSGLGFWYPTEDLAFYLASPPVPNDTIFYREALCVLSSLHHISTCINPCSQIAIFTNSSNTVDIFNSLQ